MHKFGQRTSNTQLPGAAEHTEIIAREAQRAIPIGKESIHYAEFSLAVQWLRKFGIGTTIFEKEFNNNSKSYQYILHEGKLLVDQLVVKTMKGNLDETGRLLLNAIYDYLSEQDKLLKADILFVFGSKTHTRIDKAVELYHQGLSKRLMISGGNPFYMPDQLTTEADRFKYYAIERGVPAEDIIIENTSISIPDNVRSSLNMLDILGIQYQSMILVNSPYTQRRGWIHFKKYLSDTILIMRVNAMTTEKFQRDKWFTNEDSVRILANEFIKMKLAVTMNTA